MVSGRVHQQSRETGKPPMRRARGGNTSLFSPWRFYARSSGSFCLFPLYGSWKTSLINEKNEKKEWNNERDCKNARYIGDRHVWPPFFGTAGHRPDRKSDDCSANSRLKTTVGGHLGLRASTHALPKIVVLLFAADQKTHGYFTGTNRETAPGSIRSPRCGVRIDSRF